MLCFSFMLEDADDFDELLGFDMFHLQQPQYTAQPTTLDSNCNVNN